MLKTALATLGVMACATAAIAAPQGDVSLSRDNRLVIAAPRGAPATRAPAFHHPAAATIFSNLAAKYRNGLYFSGEGDTICGINCGLGESISVAGGFTPTASATATEVEAAIGYIQGADEITLAIYSDSNGAPGTVLWSGVAKVLPTFGTCCGLAKGKIKGGLALTAGTPYWVAATPDTKEATTFAAWNLATVDQVNGGLVASNVNGAGWSSSPTILPPAFAVYK